MGVDCFAEVKRSELPVFKMSWWGWRPIVWYLEDTCGIADVEEWHVNDGHFVTAEEAARIGRFLTEKISFGEIRTMQGEDQHGYALVEQYFKVFAEFCLHSGGFRNL